MKYKTVKLGNYKATLTPHSSGTGVKTCNLVITELLLYIILLAEMTNYPFT